MSKLLTYFPAKCTPRKSQSEVLNAIDRSNKKFIIIQAPTGSGKSHISATISNSSTDKDPRFCDLADQHRLYQRAQGFGFEHADLIENLPASGTAILTVTKALQNQYDEIFSSSKIIKGRRNYTCAVDEDFDCDLAPCMITPSILEKCKKQNTCPFLNARRDSLKSKFAVYNYSAYLSLPKHLQKQQYIICDEASELEDELVKYYSCVVDYERIRLDDLGMKRLMSDNPGHVFRWLNDLVDKLKDKQESLAALFNKHKNNKRLLMSDFNKMRLYRNMYEKIILVTQNWYSTEYIIELEAKQVKFTPLNVNMLANLFFENSERVFLMSGTIIDHKTFANTLGIKDYEYIEIDSEFDPKHSPIYCLDKYKMNYKNMDKFLPKIVDLTKQICDKYPDEKGIIHTHTFKITQAVSHAVKGNKRFLLREPGVNNEYLITTHKLSTKGTVVISPSLGFGTDLSDESGRFSIIMKAPYLPLGDKRIKKLADRNYRWYQMRALVNLVQMCGRTTRNKDDYSDTYILDGTAVDLIKKNVDKLPKYFKDRLV